MIQSPAKSDSEWETTKEHVIPEPIRRPAPVEGHRHVFRPALLALQLERKFWCSGRPPNVPL
jgi:hypothetical protein